MWKNSSYRLNILGKKIIKPTITDVIALVKTAAAAKSFTFLIELCFSGETKSAMFSIDEFTNSAKNTKPMQKIINNHSIFERLKYVKKFEL